jgi:hypothetical protein
MTVRGLVTVLAFLGLAVPTAAASSLPPLPHGWPNTMQIGLTDSPGGAASLRASAPFGFRYQYLAGGVNTGAGWATWNTGGTFASMYVKDSRAHGTIPVLTYYMLLQSKPTGGDEAQVDLAHLRDPQVMEAYWADVHLLFTRIRGPKPVVVHVEPDLWGYLEQANAVPLAAAFAQRWVKLRNALAPNAILAYHMSGWGTKHDIVYEDPPEATVRSYATASARFYRSLHAKFDISFEDFSDRDAGFYDKINGNANTWFSPADFHRHLLYGSTFVKLAGIRMVAWQIPLGNTVMRAMNNTWGHFQDNRVEWLLGSSSRPHLQAYAKGGYVAFLFGGGADGTTCACDAQHDGVTDPAPISTNDRTSLNADDDGGYFRARSRAYYDGGALRLPK